MNALNRVFPRLAAAACALAIAGCYTPPEELATRFVKSQQVKASEGALLSVSAEESPELAGMQVVIPPLALAEDALIDIELGTSTLVPAEAGEPAGPAVLIGPSWQQLRAPIELLLPLEEGVDPARLFVEVVDVNGDHHQVASDKISLSADGRFARFEIQMFGSFQCGTTRPNDGGSADGGDAGASDGGGPRDGGSSDGGWPRDGGSSDAGWPRDGGSSDAGWPRDGGSSDAGWPRDGGSSDAGWPRDGGSSDAGWPSDAGSSDAGWPRDGGSSDAGWPSDGGASDAGWPRDGGSSDAGWPRDGGSSDAGWPSDAGASDAGASDAGASDAGASDAGALDAGSSRDAGP